MLVGCPSGIVRFVFELDVVEPHEGRESHLTDGNDIVLLYGGRTSAVVMNDWGSSMSRKGRIRNTTCTFSVEAGSFLGVRGCDYFLSMVVGNVYNAL